MWSKRLVLCRPQGGLNDMLCQVEVACRYADRFNRQIVVDTAFSSARTFKDSFANYFVSDNPQLHLTPENFEKEFDVLTALPHELAGRVSHYISRYDHLQGNLADTETGVLTSFDMLSDHPEELLVHHACGWERGYAVMALSRFRLREEIVRELLLRLKSIGPGYTAFHIRDTDYRTDYRERLRKMARKIKGPVFVATDNREVLMFCRACFGDGRVFSFASLPNEAGLPLHYYDHSDSNCYGRNCDALLDLLLLVLSSRYYFFPLARHTVEGNQGPKYSGFSVLAAELRQQPQILSQLLGDHQEIPSFKDDGFLSRLLKRYWRG